MLVGVGFVAGRVVGREVGDEFEVVVCHAGVDGAQAGLYVGRSADLDDARERV